MYTHTHTGRKFLPARRPIIFGGGLSEFPALVAAGDARARRKKSSGRAARARFWMEEGGEGDTDNGGGGRTKKENVKGKSKGGIVLSGQ